MTDTINRHDLPPGHFLDTRDGMKLAFGFLWLSWIDKAGKEGCAASMAKHILAGELSQEEYGEGIELARKLRKVLEK